MDLSFLTDFIVAITLAFCVGIGYMIKTSLDFIPNKYIPLIMGGIGIVFNAYVNTSLAPTIIVGGLVTGLASTGCYELFRNFIGKKEDK